MYKKRSRGVLLVLCSVLLFLFMLGAVAFGALGVDDSSRKHEIQVTRQAIRRAAVLCYATEGFYPPTLAYIEENYGVQINHELYFVNYEVFASNIMPNIYIRER